jgi:hypothetical protein
MPRALRLLVFTVLVMAATPADPVRTLEWVDLIPADARTDYSGGPAGAAHDYLGEAGAPTLQQSVNVPVNTEFDGRRREDPRLHCAARRGQGRHGQRVLPGALLRRTMKMQNKSTRLGAAAYSLAADLVEFTRQPRGVEHADHFREDHRRRDPGHRRPQG